MPEPERDRRAGQGGGGVGAMIRARRLELIISLAQLASAVGCAKSYLSGIENGHKVAVSEEILSGIERALSMPAGVLVERSRVERSISALVGGGASLDDAYRSGELQRLVEKLAGRAGGGGVVAGGAGDVSPAPLRRVPLINRVAAGLPAEFTDLGYPARVADEYVHCVEADADAFAARVVGDSMLPEYVEGDVVVFSPAAPVKSGMDCFARLEPNHEATFKRVYFEKSDAGADLIRLVALNSKYKPRVVARERVAGLFAAVSVVRRVGGGSVRGV